MAITLNLPLQPTPALTLWQYVQFVQIWTNECHAMLQVMVDAINAGGGGGIPDAPSDGSYYVRRNAAWTTEPIAGGSATGLLSSTDWTTFNNKQAAGSYLTDAPSDGKTYARQNGVWVNLDNYLQAPP